MKRLSILLALMVFLSGCAGENGEMGDALSLRSKLLSTGCSFRCRITADYIDTVEIFTLECEQSGTEPMHFRVAEPESIRDITGQVENGEAALTFDDTILAFPLMADDRLSPVSAPYLLIKALRDGYITACTREGDGLHLSINDTYADNALTLEVWTDAEGNVLAGEIGWQGRRIVSMEVEGFTFS